MTTSLSFQCVNYTGWAKKELTSALSNGTTADTDTATYAVAHLEKNSWIIDREYHKWCRLEYAK